MQRRMSRPMIGIYNRGRQRRLTLGRGTAAQNEPQFTADKLAAEHGTIYAGGEHLNVSRSIYL